jgi:hypothetical protein
VVRHEEFLRLFYERLNAGDVDGMLAMLHPDVIWASHLEGSYIRGRHKVRRYWGRHRTIDVVIEPLHFSNGPDGETVVRVRSSVREADGSLIAEGISDHIFEIQDGLILGFDFHQYGAEAN